jgi:hypothetical protein
MSAIPGGDFDTPLKRQKSEQLDSKKRTIAQLGGDIDTNTTESKDDTSELIKLTSSVTETVPAALSVESLGAAEQFETVIPLPPDDYDLTDLDGWRVAGSLGMMESETLADEIKRKIVQLTTRWSSVVEANPGTMSPETREHNLRVLTDSMVALLHNASKVLYNFTKRGIITEWLEATLAISKARSILRKS